MVTYRDWKVGDKITICAAVSPFCGATTEYIYISDANTSKLSESCEIQQPIIGGCLSVQNIELTFKLVKSSGSVADNSCRPEKVYKTIGSVRTGSNGIASIVYTVTEQDRIDYLNASDIYSNLYKVMICITDSNGQPLYTNTSDVISNITIGDPCIGVTCEDTCVNNDLWSQTCTDGSCSPNSLIEEDSLQCIPEQHTIYIGISKSFPEWFVNSMLPIIESAATLSIIAHTDYYVQGAYFNPSTYTIDVVINKRSPTPTSLENGYKVEAMVLPIIYVLGALALAIIGVLEPYIYAWYKGSKTSVKDEVPTSRTIRVTPLVCTTNDAGDTECNAPDVDVTVEYCIDGVCEEITITDGNPIAFQVPTNNDVIVTVKAINYTIYKETVVQGTSEYSIIARLASKADAKITPVAKDTDGNPIACGYYDIYEEANDGSSVLMSSGNLVNGEGPTLSIKSDVKICMDIVPCDLAIYKRQHICYTPIAGEEIVDPIIVKRCEETKNSTGIRTVYTAQDGSIIGFIADKIDILIGGNLFKSVTPTTDITNIDGLDKGITYTIHVTKASYSIIDNDQTVSFTADCFATTPLLIQAAAPANTYDVTIKITSCQTTYVLQGVDVTMDSGAVRKTDTTGSTIYIAIPEGSHSIRAAYGGYKTEEFDIVIDASNTFFTKCLTPDLQVGNIDTKIIDFDISGTPNVGSIVKFGGTLQAYDEVNTRWQDLTDAEVTVTIKKGSEIIKIFDTITKSGLLDAGDFDTPEWLIPGSLANNNMVVIASFAGIGSYKPTSITKEYFISEEECLLPFFGTCLLNKGTAKTLAIVGGVLVGVYVVSKAYTAYKIVK